MKTKLLSLLEYCFSKMTSLSALQLGLRFNFLGETFENEVAWISRDMVMTQKRY
jgi:hypothetical protein